MNNETLVTDEFYLQAMNYRKINWDLDGRRLGVIMHSETRRYILNETSDFIHNNGGEYMFGFKIYRTYDLPVNQFRFFIDE